MGDEMFRSIKQKIDGFELVKPNLESFFYFWIVFDNSKFEFESSKRG
mgnify:CR=1 FL=1